ncbi:acyltransferase [Nodosilinea sp. LEGE 07298]|uniref:acyltransferase n=1 Tax=Nodosilinea sp. LEGE 07298 TaxID=2777970 RepID=UPI001881419A|nr:acyltransferase [Nodosilinea sp. LEGE 07298]MBE9113659.1 acyltransferase [Nodosilinea sp. LEGE 07298]
MGLQSKLSFIKDYTLGFVVTGVFGWIPSPIGTALRIIAYYPILGASKLPIFIQSGVRIFGTSNIHIGKGVRIRKGTCIDSRGNNITLKDNVSIDRYVDIRIFSGYGGFVEVGENSYIAPFVFIGGPGKVQIDRDCLIASHSTIIANNHNFDNLDIPIHSQGFTCKGIHIEEGCWIGSGVRVLDGVTIGRGSVIGAGTVVTKDIPPFSVAAGVPAKVIRKRDVNQRIESDLVLPNHASQTRP